MTTGDDAAARGLPQVRQAEDIRLGFRAINALADAVVKFVDDEIRKQNTEVDPNAKNIKAGNVEAIRAGAVVSIQTYLDYLNGKPASGIFAKGPDGEDSTIQSVLDLIWRAIDELNGR
jgi:hypothetical protein